MRRCFLHDLRLKPPLHILLVGKLRNHQKLTTSVVVSILQNIAIEHLANRAYVRATATLVEYAILQATAAGCYAQRTLAVVHLL